ncbi:MAG: hypothetical protein AB1297_04895 [bacterium]
MGIFLFILGGFYAPVGWINDILIPETKSVYVATMVGVYESRDFGDSFKEMNEGFNDLHINSVETDKHGRLYAGSDDGLYILKDKKWKKVLNKPFIKKIMALDKIILVGTGVGKVYRSPDKGKSWNCVMDISSSITKIIFFNKKLYLSSYNNGIYESCDLGLSWKRIEFEGKRIRDILPSKDCFFIASEEGLFKGSNRNYQALEKGLTTKDVRVITKDKKKNTLYLGSYIGGFFVSYDYGGKWQEENTNLSNTNIRDIAISGNSIFVATEDGLYKKKEKEKKFKRISKGLTFLAPPPLSKSPEEIRKRKERLGIKPPLEGGGGH